MGKIGMIGKLLIGAGLVNSEGLSRAEQLVVSGGKSLGRALAELGLAEEELVSSAIAKGLHLEYLGDGAPDVDTEIAALLPAEMCRKRMMIPLSIRANTVRLAITDPLDYAALHEAEFRTGKQVVAVVASQTAILTRIQQAYPEMEAEKTLNLLTGAAPAGVVEEAEENEVEVMDAAKLAKNTKLPPVVRLVNLILSEAAKAGASDIHVEPQETFLLVRERVDGLLQDLLRVPKEMQDATLSRIKIISGMDISDRRRPQDGRSRLRFEGKRIDLRVSTLPTQFGEKVVIRLLNSSNAQRTMDDLGFSPDNLRVLQSLLKFPQGMILVTGPTGSGKTSSLYAALNWVKAPTNNIITVEDPIEYHLAGINQVQINTKAGVTFAAGLRSILRQDPNIILVGEIRDRETAGIALEAAQTGHLLLSTLHTNDAPATITRLLDLGIEPFLVAASVIGIVAQRLVRGQCPACVEPRAPTRDAIEKLGAAAQLPVDGKWMAGRGCDACGQTGSKGRLAIHEILPINDEIREMITRRAAEHEIRKAARRAGMRTMLEDGISKAARGLTTLEEVVRIVSPEDSSTQREESPAAPPPAPQATPPSEPVRSTPAATGGSVLIVEDDKTTATVIKYFLEHEGFQVLVAEDGEAGLKLAREQRPQVVVTDLVMPGMDGMTMVKALRDGEATRDIAIIMQTSDDSLETETKGFAVGVDDFILKPVEPRRLAARVKALLARAQTSRLQSTR